MSISWSLQNKTTDISGLVVTVAPSGYRADYNTDGVDDDVQINAAIAAVNAVEGVTVS